MLHIIYDIRSIISSVFVQDRITRTIESELKKTRRLDRFLNPTTSETETITETEETKSTHEETTIDSSMKIIFDNLNYLIRVSRTSKEVRNEMKNMVQIMALKNTKFQPKVS